MDWKGFLGDGGVSFESGLRGFIGRYDCCHTRSAIVRGGSYYRPEGSKWYFRQAYQSDQHGKLLLMAPSMDRSRTIGFRCAADSPKTQP